MTLKSINDRVEEIVFDAVQAGYAVDKSGNFTAARWLSKTKIPELCIQIRFLIEEELKNYTDFLCRTGYTDADVYAEEPAAVDRFMAEVWGTWESSKIK